MLVEVAAEQYADVSVLSAGWTTVDPPESFSSWCPESCSTRTTACLNTRPTTRTPSRSAPCLPLWTTTMNGEDGSDAPTVKAHRASLFPRIVDLSGCVEMCISSLRHAASFAFSWIFLVYSSYFGKVSP